MFGVRREFRRLFCQGFLIYCWLLLKNVVTAYIALKKTVWPMFRIRYVFSSLLYNQNSMRVKINNNLQYFDFLHSMKNGRTSSKQADLFFLKKSRRAWVKQYRVKITLLSPCNKIYDKSPIFFKEQRGRSRS